MPGGDVSYGGVAGNKDCFGVFASSAAEFAA
jgi:hypothetical protein